MMTHAVKHARTASWLLALFAAGGCGPPKRVARPPTHVPSLPTSLPWARVSGTACEGVGLWTADQITSVSRAQKFDTGGNRPGLWPKALRFFFRVPRGTPPPYQYGQGTERSTEQPRAMVMLANGRAREVTLAAGMQDADLFVANFPSSSRSSEPLTLHVWLPGPKKCVFKLGPAPVPMAIGQVGLTPRQDLGFCSIDGQAWIEPAKAVDRSPFLSGLITIAGKADPAVSFAVDAWTCRPIDAREQGLWPYVSPLQISAPELGSYATGTSLPEDALDPPPFARLRGTVMRCRVVEESLDFGTVPIKPMTRQSNFSLRPFTLEGPAVAETPSGLRISVLPRASIPSNLAADHADQTLSVDVRIDSATVTGLPRPMRGKPIRVDIRWPGEFLGKDGGPFYNPEFDTEGQTTMNPWLGIKAGATSHSLKLIVRRLAVIDKAEFDLTVPVRQDVRTNVEGLLDWGAQGTFDPSKLVRRSPQKRKP
jgi:hypothetical protein